MSDLNPLTYFPTFEEWEALKKMVDAIPPLPVKVKSVDPGPPPTTSAIQAWAEQYDSASWQRAADYQRKMRAYYLKGLSGQEGT